MEAAPGLPPPPSPQGPWLPGSPPKNICTFYCCGLCASRLVSSAHCFFHCAHRLFPVRLCKECAQSSRAAPFFCCAQGEVAPPPRRGHACPQRRACAERGWRSRSCRGRECPHSGAPAGRSQSPNPDCLHRIGAGGGGPAVAGPVGMEELAARLIDPFICVRAEEVALRLKQVGG